MKEDIELEFLEKLRYNYCNNKENSIIEESIRKNGLKKACLNNQILQNTKYKFNIEIPETKIYNQRNSSQCYIYATLRMIKSIINNDEEYDLSANYLDFYDKLEKVNLLYNRLLDEQEITLELINEQVNRYIGNYGTFHFCRNLINKYGLILEKDMKEANEKYDANLLIELLRTKIKTDAISLMNCELEKRKNLKLKLLEEAYTFLSKTMGNPPLEFVYKNKNYTPLSFKEELLGNVLDDYVTVTPFAKNVFFESYAFTPSVYISQDEIIEKMKINDIKECIIKQLKAGIGVWFSCEESTTLDYNNGILDTQIYEFNKYLGIRNTNVSEKLLLGIIGYDHAMCITGALQVNNEIIQYKVDNSFGKEGKYEGHLIMPANFLKNDLITVIINKKFIKEMESK